jgi:photosystem II stability/assembly factor-like uncharacterized protein
VAIGRGGNPSFVKLGEHRPPAGLLVWLMLCAVWPLYLQAAPQGAKDPRGVADGTLHGCVMLDIDRALAVGEREWILRTEDGGKSWNAIAPRGSSSYFGIGFDEADSLREAPRGGLIVGGRIDSVTGRSEGVVLLTKDDGKTWSRPTIVGLPRLLGLQRIGYRHWIAWGDWSDHWQSSLFETTDGGATWSARPTPSGHLQSAAVDTAGRTMLIDRGGAVFFSHDGMEYQNASFEADPFRPLRFCRVADGGWWIGGDHGQLFFSTDGLKWTRILLPGNESDHTLMQLRDVVVRENRIWLVGEPGSVVWHSEDRGRSWRVSSMQSFSSLHSIHALDDDVLLACGEFGRVQLSRNGGNAWIDSHCSGSRVACQAIASTEASMPWDILAYVVNESQRRAGALLVHHQDLQGANGHRPEWHERIIEAGRQIGLERTRVLTEFPVGNLRTGIRSTDLGYYQAADLSQSELIRRLVFEIRCMRADLIVAEDTASKHSLTSATAVASQQAIRLAGSPTFRCFSEASGIAIPAWTPQRVLLRGTESGGLNLAPSMLLNTCGMSLSEAMQPVRFLERYETLDPKWTGVKSTYRISTQRTTTIKHPLDGMILDQDTRLTEKKSLKRKTASMIAAANAAAKASQLVSTRGSGILSELAWDEALTEFAKDLPNDVLLQFLWTMAIESRRAGNWHRWNSSLNMIIERDGEGSMAELATRELMTYFGSTEVHRLVQDQWATIEMSKNSSSKSETIAATAQSSPFATGNAVAFASFDSGARLTPMARLRGTSNFERILARWPESWQRYRTEPEWAWLITSRYRTRALLRNTPVSEMKDQLHWPPKHPGMSGWTQILDQEQALSAAQSIAPPATRIPWVTSRPFLDGKADEACWSQASRLELASPWSDANDVTQIQIARDAEFLYIHSRSRKRSFHPGSESNSRPAQQNHTQRRRDALDSGKDHIRLRLDLDRDYASWFEFAWDIDGETLDQCIDMSWWNPEWYMAMDHQRETWSAEIAIPLASILPDTTGSYPPPSRSIPGVITSADNAGDRDRDVEAIDWTEQTWGISLVREIPSEPLLSVPMCEDDRWSRDRWILAYPQRSRPAQPEQPAQLADPHSAFRDTKR